MKIIKEHLFVETLNRDADLYIGLPNGYDASKSYPLVVMHDAQNLFHEADSYSGSTWNVENAIDHLELEVIVVGLSCADGYERINEYAPFKVDFDFNEPSIPSNVGGKGDVYVDYLVDELLPYIHQRYNVDKTPCKTAVIGSSMGGIISLYAAMRYPDVFGLVGSVSGAYYVSLNAMLDYINAHDVDQVHKIYLDTGDNEVGLAKSPDYIKTNQLVYDALVKKHDNVSLVVVPGGKHHESDWARRVESILKWLYA